MTLANLEKHHAHLKWLASGEFTERDFDFKIPASKNPLGEKGESGHSSMGEFTAERKSLIMQDAQRSLNNFEEKYPNFKTVSKTVPEENSPVESPEDVQAEEDKPKTKSKRKK